jgi:hypothetical protein
LSPRKAPTEKEGALFIWIPWDVRIAGVLGIAALCAEFWEFPQSIFVVIYLALCAYIVVSVINDGWDRGRLSNPGLDYQ